VALTDVGEVVLPGNKITETGIRIISLVLTEYGQSLIDETILVSVSDLGHGAMSVGYAHTTSHVSFSSHAAVDSVTATGVSVTSVSVSDQGYGFVAGCIEAELTLPDASAPALDVAYVIVKSGSASSVSIQDEVGRMLPTQFLDEVGTRASSNGVVNEYGRRLVTHSVSSPAILDLLDVTHRARDLPSVTAEFALTDSNGPTTEAVGVAVSTHAYLTQTVALLGASSASDDLTIKSAEGGTDE
jgi:hypothetical protein